jgi:hypothetical protein
MLVFAFPRAQLIARGFESVGKLLLLPNDTMSVFKPDEFIDPSDPKHASWHDLQVCALLCIGTIVVGSCPCFM